MSWSFLSGDESGINSSWVVFEGLESGLHWAMYIKQVSKSSSLNFARTNSFGADTPTAMIIKDISLLKQSKSRVEQVPNLKN